MASVEIVAVGTELLLGQLVDTNTPHIAGALASAGIDVFGTRGVGDNRERIARSIRDALERADGVITSGGLGPTVDDLTKEAVCDALGLEVELHAESLERMEAFFRSSGREMRENNRKQAMLPKGAIVLENPNGTAPGFVAFDARGKFVAAMPGVPREMHPMLQDRLLPWLRSHFGVRSSIYTRVMHTINIGESEIDHRIEELFRSFENPKIGVLAHDWRCDVKIMAKAQSEEEARRLIAPVEEEIERRLRGHIFGYDDDTLASTVLTLLQARGERVATAESCTGGNVGAMLTAVPGSSLAYVGGVVAYDNSVKVRELGVPPETLDRVGAVSEETALAMAAGARERLGADFGISTTGIAGPGGGTDEKPVGLVWLAVAGPDGAHARSIQFRGGRAAIQTRASVALLGLLWNFLVKREPLEQAHS